MSELVALIKRVASYGLAGSAVTLIPVLLLPFMTRNLSSDEFGMAMLFSAVVTITLPLMGFGAPNALGVRYYQIVAGAFSSYYWSVMSVVISTPILVVPILLFVTSGFDFNVNMTPGWALCAIFVALLWSISQAFSVLIIATGRAYIYLAINAGVAGICISLTVTLIKFFHLGWQAFAISLLLGHAVGALASILVSATWYRDRKIKLSSIADSLSYGTPVMIHSVSIGLITYFDRSIIAYYLGDSAVGVYSAAFLVATFPMFIGSAVNKAVIPWCYENLAALTPEKKKKIVRYALIGFFCVAVLILIYGYIVVAFSNLFFINDFLEVKSLAPILCIGAGFNIAYLFVVNALFFAAKTKTLAAISSGVAGVFFFGSVIATPNFGLLGSAYCFALANLLLLILTIIAAARTYRLSENFLVPL